MPFTTAQLQTLKAAIAAETDPVFVSDRIAGNTGAMGEFFNLDSTFVAWKTSVPITEIGDAINATELVGLTTGKLQQLQTISDYSGGTINPSKIDRRSAFDQVFSAASGTITRPALLALWKRFAKRGEKVFATGAGTDVAPGNLVWEGSVGNYDIAAALRA